MADGMIHIELVAPDHAPLTLEAVQAVVPGAAGVFTVLPEHTPLLTTLAHGVLIATLPDESKQFVAVHTGFCEVAEDQVLLLAETMERSDDIDTMRAQAALDRARQRLEKREPDVDLRRAEAALARATARLQARSHEEY